MEKLSTNPYKGARDFFPADKKIANYIFNTWRKVCESYGFEEYDGPFLENTEIYEAKSGEELVNEQLYSFTDKGDRRVAIRPEMTPTVSRMVASKYQQLPKPIKWFSIANFWRYEKPQRGRLREFYQLNADIFGVDSITADFEILSLNRAIMDQFKATPTMYQVRVNNRKLIDYYFKQIEITDEKQKVIVSRIIDNKEKVTNEKYIENLINAGLSNEQVEKLTTLFSQSLQDLQTIAEKSEGAKELIQLFNLLKLAQIDENIVFDPYTVRGLAYYDGTIFEQKDLNPENNRSMFGGGRYNGLIGLFINTDVPAVGFAQGDVPIKLFLESWNLLPKFENDIDYLVTVFPSENPIFFEKSQEIATKLRQKEKNIEVYLNTNTSLSKQLEYANKKGIKKVIIIGQDEIDKDTYTEKVIG
jgi:histidyl-tRNA synthetase